MNIEAISGAATVAIACTFVFLLAAKSWHLVARSMNAHPNFPDAIMREAAQRFRDEFEALSRKQSTYLGAGLMFVFIFAVAHTFEAHQLFAFEPGDDAAQLRRGALAVDRERVVPALGVKEVHQQRRAEHVAHLGRAHTGLDHGGLFLRDHVTLHDFEDRKSVV